MTQTQTQSKDPKADKRLTIALIVGGLMLAGVIVWLFSQQKQFETIPQDKGVVYYTGPKLNINTGNWVDAQGHIVSPPPGQKGKSFTPLKRPMAQ